MENLNDNVSETVLREQLQKYAGNAATVTIAYHPTTKKHLGFAHVVFVDENATGKCLKHMHGRSVMGNVVAVSKDPLSNFYHVGPFSVYKCDAKLYRKEIQKVVQRCNNRRGESEGASPRNPTTSCGGPKGKSDYSVDCMNSGQFLSSAHERKWV